ncbi:MAG: hypothetical protein WA704_08760 [Pseudolabrys sp.]|jgi:hypothetical protein
MSDVDPMRRQFTGHALCKAACLQDIDSEPEVGQEISSTLDALDNLWGGYF